MSDVATPSYAMFGADCPRCGQMRTTFDVRDAAYVHDADLNHGYEAFLRCRSCFGTSIALLRAAHVTKHPTAVPGVFINAAYKLERWVFDIPGRRPTPDYVPQDIDRIFTEGASCAAIEAWDAAGTMFRKVLDAATRSIVAAPDDDDAALKPPNWKTYKDLRLRLDWMFEHGILNPTLKDLSSCIHEDGNDAAHDLLGIGREEAKDLEDFADQILRVVYSIPGQIAENQRRRDERRTTKSAEVS